MRNSESWYHMPKFAKLMQNVGYPAAGLITCLLLYTTQYIVPSLLTYLVKLKTPFPNEHEVFYTLRSKQNTSQTY